MQGSSDPVEALSLIFWALVDMSIQRNMDYFDTLGTAEYGSGRIIVVVGFI